MKKINLYQLRLLYLIIAINIIFAVILSPLYFKNKSFNEAIDKNMEESRVKKETEKINNKLKLLNPEQLNQKIKLQQKWDFIPNFKNIIQLNPGYGFLDMLNIIYEKNRDKTIDSFYQLSDKLIPLLKEEYQLEQNEENRTRILRFLGNFRNPSCDNFFIKIIQNKIDHQCRSAAVIGLAKLSDPKNTDLIYELAENKNEIRCVRDSAIDELRRKIYFDEERLLKIAADDKFYSTLLIVAQVVAYNRTKRGLDFIRKLLNQTFNNEVDMSLISLIDLIGDYHDNKDIPILMKIKARWYSNRKGSKTDEMVRYVDIALEKIELFSQNPNKIFKTLQEYLGRRYIGYTHFAMLELSRIKNKKNQKFLNSYLRKLRPGDKNFFIDILVDNNWSITKDGDEYVVCI